MAPFTTEDYRACQPSEGGLIELQFNRRISIWITRLLVKTALTPNQVTWISFLILLPGAYLLSTGQARSLIAAGILIQLSYTLDCCDGEVSRLKGMGSKKGAWLDGALDRLSELLLFVALGVGLYRQQGQHVVWLYTFLGFAALFMTHTITMLTAQALGRGNLKASHEAGSLGRLSHRLRIRLCYLRIGIDLHMMVFAVGAVLDQLMWVNYFFITIQNAYWLAIVLNVLVKRIPENDG